MSPRPDPPRTHEPLTPEERAWAQQLASIGPHGGPPPALDAKILAAAHAAVAGRRPAATPRRWPAYVGVAASLVVAVGLAWQLRPLWQVRPPLSEAASAAAPVPADEGTLSADVLAAADPVARERVASPPPPASKPPLRARQLKAPATVVAVPAAAPAPPPPPHFQDEAIGDEPVPMAAPATAVASDAGSEARAAVAAAAEADATSRAKSSERRERAAMAAPSAFPDTQAEHAAGRASPAALPVYAPAADAPRQDTGATANSARKAMATTAPPGSGADNSSLDRIEVTGSRIRVADLPVRDDTRLAPAAWLERIRERRDADDLDGAQTSLRLFRQQHPRIRVPSDLLQLDR